MARTLGVTLLVWAATALLIATCWALVAYASEDGPGSGSLGDDYVRWQRSFGQLSAAEADQRLADRHREWLAWAFLQVRAPLAASFLVVPAVVAIWRVPRRTRTAFGLSVLLVLAALAGPGVAVWQGLQATLFPRPTRSRRRWPWALPTPCRQPSRRAAPSALQAGEGP